MPKMNFELFLFIEKRGSVTVDDVVKKFSMSRNSVAAMLSRFTNYDKDGVKKHYLVYEKKTVQTPRPGRYGQKNVRHGEYSLGPDWWGELKGAKVALNT